MARKVELLILNAEKRREDEGLVVLTTICPECGKQHFLGMTIDDFKEYKAHGLLHGTFKNESTNIRELLITGTCQECWDKLFPEDEE